MPVRRGHTKAGGRKKGTPNKSTAEVKAALLKAFDELGGVPALVKWGKQARNRTEFYKLWAKLLPQEIKNPDGETFRVTLGEDVRRRLDDVDGDGHGQPGETGGAVPANVADTPAPPGGEQAPGEARHGQD